MGDNSVQKSYEALLESANREIAARDETARSVSRSARQAVKTPPAPATSWMNFANTSQLPAARTSFCAKPAAQAAAVASLSFRFTFPAKCPSNTNWSTANWCIPSFRAYSGRPPVIANMLDKTGGKIAKWEFVFCGGTRCRQEFTSEFRERSCQKARAGRIKPAGIRNRQQPIVSDSAPRKQAGTSSASDGQALENNVSP